MNNDNQVKHHLYWIAFEMGLLPLEDRKEKYTKLMAAELSTELCEEVDKLVAHIKLNY